MMMYSGKTFTNQHTIIQNVFATERHSNQCHTKYSNAFISERI